MCGLLSARKADRVLASLKDAWLQLKRILMHITQSTSVGGLNPNWIIDCKACEMARSAWFIEETKVLLNLWGDNRMQ